MAPLEQNGKELARLDAGSRIFITFSVGGGSLRVVLNVGVARQIQAADLLQ